MLHMVHVHKSVGRYTADFLTILRRRNYVTPKDYLDFINTFLRLLIEKRDYINAQCDRLSGGLDTFPYDLLVILFYFFFLKTVRQKTIIHWYYLMVQVY